MVSSEITHHSTQPDSTMRFHRMLLAADRCSSTHPIKSTSTGMVNTSCLAEMPNVALLSKRRCAAEQPLFTQAWCRCTA